MPVHVVNPGGTHFATSSRSTVLVLRLPTAQRLRVWRAIGGPFWRETGGHVWAPEIEVLQENNELTIRADLPGLKRGEVSVEVTDIAGQAL
jgi:HSP20 family molecular chaperone IbpA